jgi:hypothetical protein
MDSVNKLCWNFFNQDNEDISFCIGKLITYNYENANDVVMFVKANHTYSDHLFSHK